MKNPVFQTDNHSSVERLDKIIVEGLCQLHPSLADHPWYIRERDVVSLFAVNYLAPLFENERLHRTMIGVEVPVLQVEEEGEHRKFGAHKDLVVWCKPWDTLWRGCSLIPKKPYKDYRLEGTRPFAVLEWKNISSILRSVCTIDKDRAKSIKWLKANLKESMFTVGYCILVDQRNSVKLDLR